jgi:hypothetical protein
MAGITGCPKTQKFKDLTSREVCTEAGRGCKKKKARLYDRRLGDSCLTMKTA